jgi:hypothetical protein
MLIDVELTESKVPRKITTFQSDPEYTRDDMFYNESNTLHTLNKWIPLSSGTFSILEPEISSNQTF